MGAWRAEPTFINQTLPRRLSLSSQCEPLDTHEVLAPEEIDFLNHATKAALVSTPEVLGEVLDAAADRVPERQNWIERRKPLLVAMNKEIGGKPPRQRI